MKQNEIQKAFDDLNAKYLYALKKLQSAYKLLEEKPDTVEKVASGDLKEAARLLASSEMNKEDLSEQEIFELLKKSSEEEVKRKIGFWAMPLPASDTDEDNNTDKIYIGKKWQTKTIN